MNLDIMYEDKNLPLRTEILEIALNMEQSVNLILITFLSIENEQRKAITNKSGNLSFKNKIDLLYDLDIFDKEDHKIFLLVMEFRNQFMHNIKCASFVHAVELLGSEKKNSLLKFSDSGDNLEQQLNNAYSNLYKRTLDISIDKIQRRKELIEEKETLLKNLNENATYFADCFINLCKQILIKHGPKEADSLEVLAVKDELRETVEKELHDLTESEKYQELRKNFDESMQSEKIKRHYK